MIQPLSIRIASIQADHLTDISNDLPDQHLDLCLGIAFGLDPQDGLGIRSADVYPVFTELDPDAIVPVDGMARIFGQ